MSIIFLGGGSKKNGGVVSHVVCHLSLTPTATATDPPPANSLIIHSMVAQSRVSQKKIMSKTHKQTDTRTSQLYD